MQRYCRVAIDSPVSALDRPFDYQIPDRMLGRVTVGSVVRVSLHGRNVRAFVVELLDIPAVPKVRAVSSLVSPEPIFTAETIALAEWTARRYVVPLGAVLHEAVPGRFSAPASDERPPAASSTEVAKAKPAWLRGALADVIGSREEACVVLPSLSAEPELAAYAVGLARSSGVSSLVICPRVDVAEALGEAIPGTVVLHGDDRPGERAAAWAAARDGAADVVVGGRSALFVPMPDLGLVLVASAHDRSLKAERTPRLHALVVARRRARMAGAAFVASSPAPPLEACAGGVKLLESKGARVRPQVARPKKGPVTPGMVDAVRESIASGRDALVFVGRLGGALRLRCVDCAFTPACEKCGTGLALGDGTLQCRVCGATAAVPVECPMCGGALSERGWGHDRVARALEKQDVGAPVVRIVRGSERSDVEDRTAPAVIVGTLAAAREIRDAGAVVVADLDQLLTRPDFRAAEVALQTLYELAAVLAPGGRFLMQTREPEHHVVQAFTRGSFGYFLDRELAFRKETGYPPFGMVVRVDLASELLGPLEQVFAQTEARVVGAVPRRGRLTALVRAPDLEPLLDPLRRFSHAHPRTKIDVDPTDVG